MSPLTSYLLLLPSVALGILYIGGSVTAIALSLIGWRRTRRPIFAGAAWFFALGFVGPVAMSLSGTIWSRVLFMRIIENQQWSILFNLYTFLLGTIVPAAGLVLLLLGARAEAAAATDGGGGQ